MKVFKTLFVCILTFTSVAFAAGDKKSDNSQKGVDRFYDEGLKIDLAAVDGRGVGLNLAYLFYALVEEGLIELSDGQGTVVDFVDEQGKVVQPLTVGGGQGQINLPISLPELRGLTCEQFDELFYLFNFVTNLAYRPDVCEAFKSYLVNVKPIAIEPEADVIEADIKPHLNRVRETETLL